MGSGFRLVSQEGLAPTGAVARFDANVAAIRILHRVQAEGRPATAGEQEVLARWGSWGAQGLSQIFDESRADHAQRRAVLRDLLDEAAYDAARRTTINAHYTHVDYARAIWDTLVELGAPTGGRVLEPGCGAGVFIGTAPATVSMMGVELDPTTAAIAALLYPAAQIRTESFAETRLPGGYFDAVVGNVPFADVRLHDPLHNPHHYVMHNHFLSKSVQLTRPGGLVAVLTSHYTLDARDPAHRRDLHHLADLVGAIRLPSGAHTTAAGTEAVTDLLILRRRVKGENPGEDDWIFTDPVTVPGPHGVEETLHINRRLTATPSLVLGRPECRVGMHGVAGLHITPTPDLDTGEALRSALAGITRQARERGWTFTPSTDDSPVVVGEVVAERDGHLTAYLDGRFTVVSEGVNVAVEVPVKQQVEVRALLELRDQARGLIAAETTAADNDPSLEEDRRQLLRSWESYVERFGPINRYTLSRPKDPTRRPSRLIPAAVRLVTRTDPYGPLVAALERFDDDTGLALPAGLLTARQIVPREPVTRADTPSDAVSISLDATGRVDLPTIAALLGCDQTQARRRIEDLVFDTPTPEGDSSGVVLRAEYLSGNVRDKLDLARQAAAVDPRWQHNVAALRAVLPPDLGPGEITAALGAVWIPADDHTLFMREVLQDRGARVTHIHGSEWIVEGNKWSMSATHDWGTRRLTAPELIQRLLTQTQILVKDSHTDRDGRKIDTLNATETEAAQEKARLLAQRFAAWVWEDPDRGARLQAEYNRRFNSIVLRDYSAEGRQLTFPGLVGSFTPRPHQRAAVARMLNEQSVGLFHVVGAGKTAEMIIGATELKRLQMIRKPAIVVPNNLLAQFTRDWMQLYPHATVLAAGADDVTADKRRAFVARVAANDWDAVILTRTAFQAISLDPRRELDYLTDQTRDIRAALVRVAEAGGRAESRVKAIEKQILRAEEKLKAKLDQPRDPGISFEETGIDYLVIDELHDYKNLRVASNIPGASIDGSQRSQDLDAKLWFLRDRYGDRVMTGATATPIANSVTEMYVMQHYLAPHLLTDAGINDFDSWAATFGEVVTGFETNLTGDKFQLRARFARFTNVPELLTMFHSFGDVKTATDLKLPVPTITARADGALLRQLLTVAKSAALTSYIEDLADRVDLIAGRQVAPRDDNMLKIGNDGRLAALDMRLVTDPDQHPLLHEPGKVDIAAAELTRIWHTTKHQEYLDPATGQPSAILGGLQIVFCDLSTPSEQWNIYHELRDQLHANGLPPGSVRFIHDATTDEAKARLFADARNGKIAVLIGSTSKMGTGTNVQDRALHVMHLDAPWRPADVTQREGRAIRQGNQNTTVQITQVITEGSFDTYMWQTLERKGRFIDQIMRGTLGGARDIEDVSEATLSFAEFKAIASGNPLLLQHAEAQHDLARLTRLAEAHKHTQIALRHTISSSQHTIEHLTGRLPELHAAAALSVPTAGDAFHITIHGQRYTKRGDAADELHAMFAQLNLRPDQHLDLGPIAELGGHLIQMTALGNGNIAFTLTAAGDTPAVTIPHADLGNPQKGTLTKLENLISRALPALIAGHEESLAEHHTRHAHATALHGQPFPHQDDLDTARQRYTTINEQLTHQTPLTSPDDAVDAVDRDQERFDTWAHATNPALLTDPDRDTTRGHLTRLAHLGADLDHLSTRLKGLHPEAIHRALETNLRQRTTAAPTSSTTLHTTQHPMGHTRSTAPRHTPPR